MSSSWRSSTAVPGRHPESNPPTHLKLEGYSAENLLDFIKADIGKLRTRPTSTQQRALSRCYSPNKDYSKVPNEIFAKNMFSVFDDLFFGSTIARRTTIRFLDPHPTLYGKFSACGDLGDGYLDLHTNDESVLTHTDALWEYAETMLHEMVHAYIRYYLSWKKGLDHVKSLAVIGKSGHGFLFQDIAYAVEREFNSRTGARLDINRPRALERELNLWKKSDWRHPADYTFQFRVMALKKGKAKPPTLPTVVENPNSLSGLRYGASSPEELLSLVKRETAKLTTGRSRSQYRALTRCPLAGTDLPQTKTRKNFLTEMLWIFDDLLFGSTIAARTSLKFDGVRHPVLSRTYGDTDLEPGHRVTITVESMVGIWKTHTQRLWHYAGTLLHEMVHAYIDLYLSPGIRIPRFLAYTGVTGHGFLWHDIACTVETAFNAITGIEVDIGRQLDLVRELSKWPRNDWREVNTVARWGLKPEFTKERISRKINGIKKIVRKMAKT